MAGGFVFYHYKPSMAAAVIFIILFIVSAIWHMYQMVTKKTWYFIPFIIGCIFEVIGYAGRAISSNESPDFTKMPYIIQSTFLLLGPTLMAASIYMVLGRLVLVLHGDRLVLIRPRFLTKIFVLGDVLSFFAQGGGGGIMASATTPDKITLGNNVIIGGLGIQILFFGFFMVVIGLFHGQIHRHPTPQAGRLTTPWRTLIYVLYLASSLIMVRSAYRIVEYIMGQDGVLMKEEKFLYVFDAIPMSIVALTFNFFHPSRVVDHESLRAAKNKNDLLLEELGNEYSPLSERR